VRELARAVEGAGVSMLAVHARTRAQGFSGVANWDLIAQAKDAVSIPVVGNGDVRSADDVARMHAHTGCDAVMIGRAAIGNPWVFDEVKSLLDGRAFTPPTPRERARTMVRHLREAVRLEGEPGGVIASRKVMAAYLKRVPHAREARGRLMQALTLTRVEEVVDAYLDGLGPLADAPFESNAGVESSFTEC
jgi:tRNA-dihydrouridine synthase